MYYILASLGDGPYWRSGLEVLLYPTGCSFYRPYSYRKSWVGDAVIPSTSEESEAIVGYRFKNQATGNNLFVPLRRATQVLVGGQGEHHVRFTLGKFIVHDGGLKAVDLDVHKGELPGFGADKLLLAVNDGDLKKELAGLESSDALPTRLWDKLRDDPRIGKHPSADHFRTTMLRLLGVRAVGKNEALKPDQISGDGLPTLAGYRFEAGSVYELDVEFRTLLEKDAPDLPCKVRYELQVQDNRLVASRPALIRTGNYREEALWIKPKVAEPAPCLLEWVSRVEPDGNDQASCPKALDLRVLYSVAKPSRVRFKTGVSVLGVLLALTGVSLFIGAAFAENGAGEALVGAGAVALPSGLAVLAYWFQQWHALDR